MFFAIHSHESAMGVHVFSILNLPPTSLPHPIPQGYPECPVSYIRPGLAIYLTYDNIHVSLLFFQIIPPSHSPTESKSLFFTSVSLVLFCILCYHYHLFKFHIFALVYCIGVYLSGLLHSISRLHSIARHVAVPCFCCHWVILISPIIAPG